MSALERHYSIKEISEMWGYSQGVVRRLFRDRGDVLRVGHKEFRFKRGYETIRVPESVVEKVHAELRSKKGGAQK